VLNKNIIIGLNLIPWIETKSIIAILEDINSLQDISRFSIKDLMRYPGIGEMTAKRISEFNFDEALEKELNEAEKTGTKIITIKDKEYPVLLQNIYSPPVVLYLRGDPAKLHTPMIAIVGTRKPSPYGLQIARKLSAELAQSGITVISGMASGTDSIAHKSAILAGGLTVAVLGCGVDVIYPPGNKDLYKEIITKGLIISELPFGSAPAKNNFPIRNRIISGLSLGTLVVEAAEKSGALITAKYAIEQGRELFAVPGSITSRQSVGPNYLIKQGAKLVQRVADILDELP
jgi:DNA processing protein